MEYDLLLTPAIAVGLFTYLVNFFGKTITDQSPVVDERSWHTQISGTMFMINMLTGLIGVYIALKFPWGIGHWWLHAITVCVFSFIYTSIFGYGRYEASEIYQYGKKALAKQNEKLQGLPKFLAEIGEYIGIAILPILVFYFGTLEYLSGNIYWIITTVAIAFLMFIQSAFNFSLKSLKVISPATIYFTNKDNEPLTNVYILKEKEDSYRVRIENKIMLINKSEILWVEATTPEELR